MCLLYIEKLFSLVVLGSLVPFGSILHNALLLLTLQPPREEGGKAFELRATEWKHAVQTGNRHLLRFLTNQGLNFC